MLSLTSCQSVVRETPPVAGRLPGLRTERPRMVEPQEPIHVRVRVREYGDFIKGTPQASSTRPDLSRMPVGILLDCYV